MPIGLGAGALAAGALGAGATLYGASQAAGAQKSATGAANNLQMEMFSKLQNNLAPFMDLGKSASGMLYGQDGSAGLINSLIQPFAPTQANLEQTPGYQFTLDQGMKAVNNSNSAKGWGLSGAGQKGLADYATGLASNTYQQQFGNYWTNNSNAFNMLNSGVQTGLGAATTTGNAGLNTGQVVGNNLTSLGNAQGAAAIAQGNAVAGAPTNTFAQYSLLQSILQQAGQGGNPGYAAQYGLPVGARPL